MNLKVKNAKTLKIIVTAFIFLAFLSPLYFYMDQLEPALNKLVSGMLMGNYSTDYFPYIYYALIVFFALVILGIITLAVNRVFTGKAPPELMVIKLKTREVTASFDSYLKIGKYYGVSIIPGFRTGKNIKKAAALIYFAISLLPLLEGNQLITAILISVPFIVYEIQGAFDKKWRKIDLKLKIFVLLCFLPIFTASVYFTVMDIKTGGFKSSFSSGTICSIPDVMKRLNLEIDEKVIYDTAIVLDRENALPYYKKGILMEKAGDLKQAEYNFKRAAAYDSDNYEIYYRLNKVYVREGNSEKALEMLKKAQLRNPDFAPAFYEAAKLLKEKGDLEHADKMVDISLKINNDDFEAHRLKAAIYLAEKRYKEALKSYSMAIRLNPKKVELYSEKAEALVAEKRLDEALYNMEKALKLNPDDAVNCFKRGMILLNRNNFSEAVASFKKSLQLKPDFVTAKGWLAMADLKAGNPAAAKEEIAEALKNANDNAVLRFIDAYILFEGRSYVEALQEIDSAISYDGKQSGFYSLKAEILLKKGDAEYVGKLIGTAFSLNADDEYAFYVKGRRLLLLNVFDGAAEAFDRAVELNPYFSRAYAGRAVAASFMNDGEKADDCLDAAMKLNPDDYFNYYAKSVIYFAGGHYMGSLASINKAIEMHGEDAELSEQKLKIAGAADSAKVTEMRSESKTKTT